ncbi:helix-turn-helix domain-containing protein [uncultured Nostoc sp.]|uniref:helix-turn-helix domain-containing protein n=1 Tax=uncultured Nostoc sp. TaxID=340711 RepID=UPI0035CAA9D4
MQKAFKVTLIPNHSQEILINKSIGCARFVYNHFLALKQELYLTEQKILNITEFKKRSYVKHTKNYPAL